jgi:hypothetical protein
MANFYTLFSKPEDVFGDEAALILANIIPLHSTGAPFVRGPVFSFTVLPPPPLPSETRTKRKNAPEQEEEQQEPQQKKTRVRSRSAERRSRMRGPWVQFLRETLEYVTDPERVLKTYCELWLHCQGILLLLLVGLVPGVSFGANGRDFSKFRLNKDFSSADNAKLRFTHSDFVTENFTDAPQFALNLFRKVLAEVTAKIDHRPRLPAFCSALRSAIRTPNAELQEVEQLYKMLCILVQNAERKDCTDRILEVEAKDFFDQQGTKILLFDKLVKAVDFLAAPFEDICVAEQD